MIVFGKGPRVEVPPAPSELNLMGVESTVDAENTDLAAAMKLALATFPEDTARRIVILSDGNENRGNLLEQTLVAKSLGVQVDVLPIDYFYDREVLVEKEARRGGLLQARTRDFKTVIIPGGAEMIGEYVDVELTGTTGSTFTGVVVRSREPLPMR